MEFLLQQVPHPFLVRCPIRLKAELRTGDVALGYGVPSSAGSASPPTLVPPPPPPLLAIVIVLVIVLVIVIIPALQNPGVI
jgi:hypothetical protein